MEPITTTARKNPRISELPCSMAVCFTSMMPTCTAPTVTAATAMKMAVPAVNMM